MLDKDMCDRKKTTCETVQKQDFFFIFARKSAYEGTNFVEFLLYASDCFSKSSRGKIIEITCPFIIFQTIFLAFKGPLKAIKLLFHLFLSLRLKG